MTEKDTLILVDGSSFLFRAYHALPELSNSRGEPTGAVYGIINMLRKLLNDYRPSHIAVVFDAKGKNFRHELYPEYKANRPPMPDDLRTQLERVKEIVQAMGLPVLSIPGVEADDVIGTLSVRAVEAGYDALIVSGDKDLAQLVNGGVEMVDTMQGVRYDSAGVKKKFGVPPRQIVDYLALVGDSSDNIPGVPKVGPKTAAKWLAQYDSLDKIIEHADEIGGKVGESLRDHLKQLPLARELATVRCDVGQKEGLEQAPNKLAADAPNRERLRELFALLEFRNWLLALDTDPASPPPAAEPVTRGGYQTILDTKTLERWLKKIGDSELLAVDTETTALDAQQAQLVGISFAVAPGEAAYLPLAHDYPGAPRQLPLDETLDKLRPVLENAQPQKVGQNLKYDLEILANAGIEMQGIAFDTMLESYLLDAGNTRHDMDTLALKHLGHRTITYKDVAGSGKKQLTFNQVDLEHAALYAAEDADITLRLHQALYPRLARNNKLKHLFEEIEMPLVPVLARVEANGVRIDTGMLKRQSEELSRSIVGIERRAHEVAG
ncbi:MAG: 5'-3' exonuclease H3TH domain-containing protein, partial [Pseudomonadota bacterium]|nr:5'-3' exonuclease H3TH domain-containing protein [Pseudomonadota bacterium]